MINETLNYENLVWLRPVHSKAGRDRAAHPAVIIRQARQGARQDAMEIALDRQMLADHGIKSGDRVSFAVDPRDRGRLYIAKADSDVGYKISKTDRYAARIVISGRRAQVIWHMIGKYEAEAIEAVEDGVLCVRRICARRDVPGQQ